VIKSNLEEIDKYRRPIPVSARAFLTDNEIVR